MLPKFALLIKTLSTKISDNSMPFSSTEKFESLECT